MVKALLKQWSLIVTFFERLNVTIREA